MNKKIENLIRRTQIAHDNFERLNTKLSEEVNSICDFKAEVTFCEGDGLVVLDVDTSDVGTLDCLEKASKKNKLTRDGLFEYGI
jgi:hypothetical protein